ncbi:site-specific DNA-methyltransferase [Helicobacter pylori]|uniref:site-specific DNA-methyltransferase n=1 Tax=Helicobacter pylori TaxID=210 RepID=UPI001FD0F69C|nr:site-specific DNA-methyltransferase [Helicobacter pylori]UOS52264.1 site-specific DNA-methyltransferase [Helicobacter pylori]
MQNKEIDEEKSVNEKNVEIFNRYFPGCLSIENDNKLTLDIGKLKALLGDFSEIKEEGYGLDFVGKKIALNQAFKKNHKILKPLNKSTSKHILIKGDNLDALKILKQSYSEKIKMIYIDPPYNTKNENFIYDDDFSQSNEEVLKTLDYSKEKLDYIKNLFGSKCHSGWLSFMYPRLLLAKDLLKQDGVIFISIDDNECAQLKLLCDEIFGEGNFVADFIRKTKSTTNDAKTGVNYQHEFLLCYAKDKNYTNLLGGEKNLKNYKNPDNDPNGAWINDNPSAKSGNIKTGYFGVTNPYTNKVDYPPVGMFWRFSQNTLQKHIDEGRICFKKEHKDNERGFIYKRYLKDLKTTQKTFDSLIFSDNCYMNQVATKELLSLELAEYFSYPKGVDFMAKIVEHATEKGDIILDFFAGSGTTAHAVLESNKSDYQKLSEGGGLFNGLNAAFKERRFILIQLDEKIDPKKNKSAHDFCLNTLKSTSPSIFDITEERIKRAGAKIQEACPDLDVGFRAFEIINDETHANDKNLSQAHQKDLFAYSNPEKMETQTILIKLLGCEGLELTTPIICLIENALYLALNTAFIVGDIEMSEVLENLKDKGVEKISMYMPAISNDRLCLELGSNLLDLKLESGDLKIRG